jgi:hypothetical protein
MNIRYLGGWGNFGMFSFRSRGEKPISKTPPFRVMLERNVPTLDMPKRLDRLLMRNRCEM